MQILIYKTDLTVERAPAWLAPTAPVRLAPETDGRVSAFADRPASLFGLLPGGPVRIGRLSDVAREMLLPALLTGVSFRVRIVELIPAHLAPDGRAQIAVSVWGDPSRLTRPAAEPTTEQG